MSTLAPSKNKQLTCQKYYSLREGNTENQLYIIIKDGILRFYSFNITFKRGVYFISLIISKMIYCLY